MTIPGSVMVVFRGGPVGLYHGVPMGDVFADIADDSLEGGDGVILIIAALDDWCLILSSTGKLGWVSPNDLCPFNSGSVYHTKYQW